jgi:hypothetical protein
MFIILDLCIDIWRCTAVALATVVAWVVMGNLNFSIIELLLIFRSSRDILYVGNVMS